MPDKHKEQGSKGKKLSVLVGVANAKMSTEELRAAMRNAEDETDAAAATAAEQETAEELAEFTAEPAPGADNEDEDGEAGERR